MYLGTLFDDFQVCPSIVAGDGVSLQQIFPLQSSRGWGGSGAPRAGVGRMAVAVAAPIAGGKTSADIAEAAEAVAFAAVLALLRRRGRLRLLVLLRRRRRLCSVEGFS